MPLASDINLNEIAVSTQNYTGADLSITMQGSSC